MSIKKNLLTMFLVFSLFVLPVVSFAQNIPATPRGNIPATPQGNIPASGSTVVKIVNPLKTDNINGFVKDLLTGIMRLGIPLIALAIIYCGFLFVWARGNPEKITEAKNALLYTLIGALLLLGSWAIAQLITNTVISL